MKRSRYLLAQDATKRRLLVAALKRYPTYRGAAQWLGASTATVWRDCKRLGIRVATTHVVHGGV